MKNFMEGHLVSKYMGIFIGIFSIFGIVASILTDNHAFIGVGPAIGVAVGSAVENKYKAKGLIVAQSTALKKQKILFVIIGSIALLIGVLALFLLR